MRVRWFVLLAFVFAANAHAQQAAIFTDGFESGDVVAWSQGRALLSPFCLNLFYDYDRSAVVERVIDGDTIELVGGERVRYIGMDTGKRGIWIHGGDAAQCSPGVWKRSDPRYL